MTTANKITLVRIAMIPFFVVFALMDGVQWQALALAPGWKKSQKEMKVDRI